jgi:hypothetical protein
MLKIHYLILVERFLEKVKLNFLIIIFTCLFCPYFISVLGPTNPAPTAQTLNTLSAAARGTNLPLTTS